MAPQVTLDGHPLDCPEPGLAGAIRAGRSAAGARLIVEVRIDGRVVDPDNPAAPDAALRDARRVELLSAHPAALARCTLLDAADALEEISTVQADAAGLLQTGDTERAMALLRRSLDVWGGVAQTIDLISQIGVTDPSAPASRTLAPGSAHPRLNACLRAVRASLEVQDHAALADTLAYDLRDLAAEWTQELRSLAQGINAHHSTSENAA